MSYAFLNGKILPLRDACLHITDLAILRAYGVFDFFRAVDGIPVFISDHLDRFFESAKMMHLDIPFSKKTLSENIIELIELNPNPLLGLKLICTGGYSENGYTPSPECNLFILAAPFSFHPYSQGLRLLTVDHQRELPEIKTINYIVPIQQIPRLQAENADDVLYHQNGMVTESSRSNIFIVRDGILITPDRGILYGITRKKILNFTTDLMPVEVRPVSLAELKEADEVFLASSTKRISSVTSIDEKSYKTGPATKELYQRLLEEEKKS